MGKHRDDRQGSRRREWGDDNSLDFQVPSFFSRPQAAVSDTVDAQVLWFNAAKGFGFVQPTAGEKAFLHIRQLETAGLSDIAEGAQLRVVIEPGPKGLSVTKITDILSEPAAPDARQQHTPRGPGQDGAEAETVGTVKWFNAEKGFGFIGREDGDKDIFVHASALGRSKLSELKEGQTVLVRYVQGPKGPEARTVKLSG